MYQRLKKWFLLVAVALLPLVFGGCTLTERLDTDTTQQTTQSTPEEVEKRIGLGYYAAENVNPVTGMSEINAILCNALYEGLFVLDETFTPCPVLCDSYTVSGNGAVYTFILKENIKFWSGAPLTATDVAESYRLVKNSPGTRYYSRFQEVLDIMVLDERTLQITLERPNVRFVSLLDIPVFRAGSGQDAFADGTGAFQPLKEESGYHLEAFSGWHGEANPEIDRIDLISTVRTNSVVYSFSTGDVSMTRAERICDDPISLSGAVDVYQTPSTEMHYLGVNLAGELTGQPQFRQGLSALLDRASICKNALQTHAVPAILPQNPQPTNLSAQNFQPSAEQAAELFSQIGVTDSDGDGFLDYISPRYWWIKTPQPVVLTILVNAENVYKQAVLSEICLSFNQAGIQTKVVSVDFETYLTELTTGKYDLYYGDVVLQPDFDVRSLLASGGALNYGGYSDPAMDGLLTGFRSSDTELAQNSFYEYFLHQMPIIPFAFEQVQVVLRGGLIENYSTMPAQLFSNYPMWRWGA